MVGVLGFEPKKCWSQSPMPYHLAIPQYQLTPSLYYEIARAIMLVGKVGLEPTTALST